MTLTKAQRVEALSAKNISTKIQSAQIIDTLFELIKQSLQNGEDVLISGCRRKSLNHVSLLLCLWFRQLDLAPFDTFIWPHPQSLSRNSFISVLALPEVRVPTPKIRGCRWRLKRREPVGRLEFQPPPAKLAGSRSRDFSLFGAFSFFKRSAEPI